MGESVTVASKLESFGRPDCIHASEVVRLLAPGEEWKASASGAKVGESCRGGGGTTYLLSLEGASQR